jgi:hypothetical protein
MNLSKDLSVISLGLKKQSNSLWNVKTVTRNTELSKMNVKLNANESKKNVKNGRSNTKRMKHSVNLSKLKNKRLMSNSRLRKQRCILTKKKWIFASN